MHSPHNFIQVQNAHMKLLRVSSLFKEYCEYKNSCVQKRNTDIIILWNKIKNIVHLNLKDAFYRLHL